MASSLVSRYFTFYIFIFASIPLQNLAAEPPSSFTLEELGRTRGSDSEIALYADAEIGNSTVRLTRPAASSSGRILYRRPIKFLGENPGFSTYFAFSVSIGKGGSFAFLAIPSSASLESIDGHGIRVSFEMSGEGVEVDVGSEITKRKSNLSDADANLVLAKDGKLHSWIDYDGAAKRLEVRLSKSRALRPSTLLLSYGVDLSNVLTREAMFVGISCFNGNSTLGSSVYSWSFLVRDGARYRMHSEPLDPNSFLVQSQEGSSVHVRRNYRWRIILAMVFGAACGALAVFIVFFLRHSIAKRHPVAPVEYPVHPVEIGYEKIVLVGEKKAAKVAGK